MNRHALVAALVTTFAGCMAVADFEKGIAAYQAINLPLACKEFRAAADVVHADW